MSWLCSIREEERDKKRGSQGHGGTGGLQLGCSVQIRFQCAKKSWPYQRGKASLKIKFKISKAATLQVYEAKTDDIDIPLYNNKTEMTSEIT